MRLRWIGAGVFVLWILPRPAHAYLEPGLGSILMQALIGSSAAAVAATKLYWHELTGFWKRLRNKPVDNDEEQAEAPEAPSTSERSSAP